VYTYTTETVKAEVVNPVLDGTPQSEIRVFRFEPPVPDSQHAKTEPSTPTLTSKSDALTVIPDPANDMAPDSPPMLYYADDIDAEYINVDEFEDTGDSMDDVQPVPKTDEEDMPGLEKDDRMPDEDDDGATEVPPTPTMSTKEKREVLNRIQGNLTFLEPFLSGLQRADNEHEIYEGLANLGLLQVTHDIGKERVEGRSVDQEYWGGVISRILESRCNGLEGDPEKVIEDLANQDVPAYAVPIQKKDVRATDDKENQVTNLEEEATVDVPAGSCNLKEWAPNVNAPVFVPLTPPPDIPYAPKSPDPEANYTPYVPRSPEPTELDEVRKRVFDLEEHVDLVVERLKDRVRDLENQMLSDGSLLTELNWKSNEWDELEDKSKSDKKGRRRRKNTPDSRRGSPKTDENVAEVKRDLGRMSKQVRTLEERMKTAEREIMKIQAKLEKALVLGPEVRELASLIEEQQRAQADVNAHLFEEIAELRRVTGTNLGALDSRFLRHEWEINTLCTRYQQLYNFAMNVFYPSPTTTANQHATGSFIIPVPKTPIPVPNRQAVAAN
jgi:chaperonin cofactor prefoldin